MNISRRRLFLLSAAATAAASLPAAIAKAFVPRAVTWLPCDGRLLSRTVYKELFAVIGNNYGPLRGSDHWFNIPDLRAIPDMRLRPHMRGWLDGRPPFPPGTREICHLIRAMPGDVPVGMIVAAVVTQ